MILTLCTALLAAGVARVWAQQRRLAITPEGLAVGVEARSSNLGQLNSFALGLLLGGLRGPLVMALWSSSEGQKAQQDFEDFDTKVELIRLLQPQFDSVHLYQIWNKAYNISVEMVNLASKYAAILDAIDYGRRVLRERPANIDLETYLGEVFNNKLGASQEADYYKLRIHEETQADQPVVKVTFPIGREGEFRSASRRAGVSPRRLLLRRMEDPGKLMAAMQLEEAERLRPIFAGPEVQYTELAPRQIGTRGVSGPMRMEPMLDEEGYLLSELTAPRRPALVDREPGTYLDGSAAQFLVPYQPFPEGLSPHALAYNHFMRAWVLQTYGGQRHVQYTEASIAANPGRALRDWALAAYEEGRLLEAEAFGRNVLPPGHDGELQAALEREVADVSLASEPVSPQLLRQALERYERAVQISTVARAWLEGHIERYPGARSVFESNITRLAALEPLIRADLVYARMLLDEAEDHEAARRQAEQLYLEAHRMALDFIMRHHTPAELMQPRTSRDVVLSLPIWDKWELLELVRRQRDLRPEFEHARAVTEYEGYFDRIAARLAHLRAHAATRTDVRP